jgi:hypothetical protein
MNGKTATKEKAPQTSPRGGRFVRPGQRFIGVFGGRRAWNIVIAIAGFAALGVLAIFGEIILNLQNQLAQRQPYIVGLTTAHQLVPLFPDGAAPVTCDALCIDGELESWVVNLRTITGEQDTAQLAQHRAQAIAASMVGVGTDADRYVKQYYATFNPYTLSAKGVKLDVRNVHVNAEVGVPNRYDAHWTDVVVNTKTGQEVARHPFSAYIDATSVPAARIEENVKDNPGGVVVTHVEQFGVTQ